MPEGFGIGGYLRDVTTRSGTRPPFRNHTVRAHRPEAGVPKTRIAFTGYWRVGRAG